MYDLPLFLKLEANQSSDNPYSQTLDFSIKTSMWQVNFPLSTTSIQTGTAVVDLNGGGREIIFGDNDSLLHVITKDGWETQWLSQGARTHKQNTT